MNKCGVNAKEEVFKETDGVDDGRWLSEGFYAKASELLEREEPFATATVVKTEGHTIGRTGFKAIIRRDQTIIGYVGGSCVDVAVIENALEALRDGQSRMVNLELEEEEKGGLGPPCGGIMQIYVEPHLPKERLLIFSAPGERSLSTPLVKLGRLLGFRITVFEPLAEPEKYPDVDELIHDDATLAFTRVKITTQTYVVLAARHGYDVDVLKKIIDSEAAYIGMIGSQKRIRWIFSRLVESGIAEEKLRRIVAPVGLDIGAKTPQEITMSIMADIVRVRRGGTGRPLIDIKGAYMESLAVPEP